MANKLMLRRAKIYINLFVKEGAGYSTTIRAKSAQSMGIAKLMAKSITK